jgi:hypothetical protein
VNLTACGALPTIQEKAVWYRLVDPRYIAGGLDSAHTKVVFSRFNAATLLSYVDQFSALYFAESPLVAQFEMGAMVGKPSPGGHLPHPNRPFVSINVHISLFRVIDLTDVGKVQKPLGTTAQELTGDWDGYQTRTRLTSVTEPTGMAPTQVLGLELFRTGVEGFIAISARVPYAKTLTVFVDNIRSGSTLSYTDSAGNEHKIAP